MNAKEYLIAKMKQLVKQVELLKTSYSFDLLSDTHSVEILPNEQYHNNDIVKEWEFDTLSEFMDLFPQDSLCILTDTSIIPIENIELFFEGKKFNCCVEEKEFFDEPSVDYFESKFYDTFETIFNTLSPQLLDNIDFYQQLIDVNSLPSIFNGDLQFVNTPYKPELNIASQLPIYEASDEDNYSFAA